MIVYRHIRLDKNEPFYIGIGKSESRAYRKDGRNPLWNKIVAKTPYKVQIIFDDLTKQEACEKEKELIALYGRKVDDTGILTNLTPGGDILSGKDNPAFDKGVSITIEDITYPSIFTASRKLGIPEKTIRYRVKSENFPDYNYTEADKKVKKLSYEEIAQNKITKNPMFGKNHSESSKKEISLKNKGKKKTRHQLLVDKIVKPNRKEVLVNNVRYMSVAHAAHFLGVAQSVMAKAIHKGYKCKGNIVTFAPQNEYSKELIELYIQKYPDKTDVYPHPKLIDMLKSLTSQA